MHEKIWARKKKKKLPDDTLSSARSFLEEQQDYYKSFHFLVKIYYIIISCYYILPSLLLWSLIYIYYIDSWSSTMLFLFKVFGLLYSGTMLQDILGSCYNFGLLK